MSVASTRVSGPGTSMIRGSVEKYRVGPGEPVAEVMGFNVHAKEDRFLDPGRGSTGRHS